MTNLNTRTEPKEQRAFIPIYRGAEAVEKPAGNFASSQQIANSVLSGGGAMVPPMRNSRVALRNAARIAGLPNMLGLAAIDLPVTVMPLEVEIRVASRACLPRRG